MTKEVTVIVTAVGEIGSGKSRIIDAIRRALAKSPEFEFTASQPTMAITNVGQDTFRIRLR